MGVLERPETLPPCTGPIPGVPGNACGAAEGAPGPEAGERRWPTRWRHRRVQAESSPTEWCACRLRPGLRASENCSATQGPVGHRPRPASPAPTFPQRQPAPGVRHDSGPESRRCQSVQAGSRQGDPPGRAAPALRPREKATRPRLTRSLGRRPAPTVAHRERSWIAPPGRRAARTAPRERGAPRARDRQEAQVPPTAGLGFVVLQCRAWRS